MASSVPSRPLPATTSPSALPVLPLHPVHQLLPHSPLPPHEKLVWLVLIAWSPSGQAVSRRHREIVQATGLSLSAVKNALEALHQRGLVSIEAHRHSDGQQLANTYTSVWDAWLKDPTSFLYSAEHLEHVQGLVRAYERGLEQAYEQLLLENRREKAKTTGKPPPKGKVRLLAKHAPRPWHLRVRLLGKEGQALQRLAREPLRFEEEGKWVQYEAGERVVERVATWFWWSTMRKELQPTRALTKPSEVEGLLQKVLADEGERRKWGVWAGSRGGKAT